MAREPVIAEVVEDEIEDSSEGGMPELDEEGDAGEAGSPGGARQSRSERKSRKAMTKLGMRPVAGVTRVTLKKGKNAVFTIEGPDVFKSPGGDTYVIFGEAKVEDASGQAQAAAAQQFSMPGMGGAGGFGGGGGDAGGPSATVEVEGEEDGGGEGGGEDEAGFEAKDVELVMTQAGVSRGRAVKALKASNGDIVSAIMELTM
ncbi:MAG: NAC domain-containing protein [Monoraphidium minutum]|nr:MAG: NAC domain-containing protein [Monoraphidium minutum]